MDNPLEIVLVIAAALLLWPVGLFIRGLCNAALHYDPYEYLQRERAGWRAFFRSMHRGKSGGR